MSVFANADSNIPIMVALLLETIVITSGYIRHFHSVSISNNEGWKLKMFNGWFQDVEFHFYRSVSVLIIIVWRRVLLVTRRGDFDEGASINVGAVMAGVSSTRWADFFPSLLQMEATATFRKEWKSKLKILLLVNKIHVNWKSYKWP